MTQSGGIPVLLYDWHPVKMSTVSRWGYHHPRCHYDPLSCIAALEEVSNSVRAWQALQKAAPSIIRHCGQRTCKSSSGPSIGIPTYSLQLTRSGWTRLSRFWRIYTFATPFPRIWEDVLWNTVYVCMYVWTDVHPNNCTEFAYPRLGFKSSSVIGWSVSGDPSPKI